MKALNRREAIQIGARLFMGLSSGVFLQSLLSGCSNQEIDQNAITQVMQHTTKANLQDIKLSIVYDNFRYDRKLKADWGFSCLIEGMDRTILFDTGRYDDIFVSNMSKLNIDPHHIEEVVISHDHPDHVGGVPKLLEINPNLTVKMGKSFPSGFKKEVRSQCAQFKEVDQPCAVSKNCVSTGELKSFIRNEQSLVILTDKGSIVLSGCAHPRVVEIVERAKWVTKQEVLLVAGGFHLLADYGSSLDKIASNLKHLGVQYVVPTHCSGEEARNVMARVFGDKYLEGGVGRVITAKDLAKGDVA
jgi:7,8-dihydropterin-6-yl-methyl-4-(beta-D-ribofuranosyl)aminobenzene 5'-phosphate synthase